MGEGSAGGQAGFAKAIASKRRRRPVARDLLGSAKAAEALPDWLRRTGSRHCSDKVYFQCETPRRRWAGQACAERSEDTGFLRELGSSL